MTHQPDDALIARIVRDAHQAINPGTPYAIRQRVFGKNYDPNRLRDLTHERLSHPGESGEG